MAQQTSTKPFVLGLLALSMSTSVYAQPAPKDVPVDSYLVSSTAPKAEDDDIPVKSPELSRTALKNVDFKSEWFESLTPDEQKTIRQKYDALFKNHRTTSDRPQDPKLAALGKTNTEIRNDWFSKARKGDIKGLKALIAHGFNPNIQDAQGYTAIILATYYDRLETVEDLIKSGAKPCLADHKGNTALMGAAFKGYLELLHELKDAGCSVNAQNHAGQTAMMIAASAGHTDAVDALLAMDADPNIEDSAGATAMSLAATHGKTEVVNLLKPYVKKKDTSLLGKLVTKVKGRFEKHSKPVAAPIDLSKEP